jgi:hypothetical protein
VKRVPELRDLSDDHHTGLVLARHCRRAGEPDSARDAARAWTRVREAFASHLEPHFQIEERYLLPALDAIGEGGLASRVREDHAALRELLRAGPADRAALARFGERLDAHIRSEEREVFEATQHRLPPAALEAIAAACRATPRVCTVSLDE